MEGALGTPGTAGAPGAGGAAGAAVAPQLGQAVAVSSTSAPHCGHLVVPCSMVAGLKHMVGILSLDPPNDPGRRLVARRFGMQGTLPS